MLASFTGAPGNEANAMLELPDHAHVAYLPSMWLHDDLSPASLQVYYYNRMMLTGFLVDIVQRLGR